MNGDDFMIRLILNHYHIPKSNIQDHIGEDNSTSKYVKTLSNSCLLQESEYAYELKYNAIGDRLLQALISNEMKENDGKCK